LAPKELDKDGREVAGSRGYKYFGAAKDLPGVRELFQQQVEGEGPPKRSRAELVKNIDAHYFGYMDEDDGWLIPLEKAEEEKAIARLNAEWEEKGPEMNRIRGIDDDIYKVDDVSHFLLILLHVATSLYNFV
jgi:pre-mRNA-splicing factor ISY1